MSPFFSCLNFAYILPQGNQFLQLAVIFRLLFTLSMEYKNDSLLALQGIRKDILQ
jgi:hypothetical protein